MATAAEPLRGVIFDLDGVLVDCESLKAEAHAANVASFGGRVDPLFYGTVMGGAHEYVRSVYFRKAAISPEPEAYSQRYREEYDRLLDGGLRPFPGVLEMLGQLRRRGLKLAVATSSKQWMVDRVFSLVELRPLFDVIITADDVIRHKPDPEAYLLALRKLGLDAQSAVVIEDSETGLTAAVRAGVRVIAYRHAFNAGHDLSSARGTFASFEQPDDVARRLEQFLVTSLWE
jgi:HAD superfamily hydrolase (TIGR01509 family)